MPTFHVPPPDDGERIPPRELFRYLSGLAWPFRRRIAGWIGLVAVRAAALAVFVRLLDLAVASLRAQPAAMNSAAFWSAAGGLLLCQIIVAVAQYLADETQRWALEGMEVGSLREGLDSLLRLPPDYFQRHSLAKVVLKLEKLEHVVRAVMTQAAGIVSRAATMIGLMAGAVWAAPGLGLLALGVMAAVTFALWRRTRRLREVARQEFALDVGLVDRIHAIFAQPRDLHNFGLRERALDQFSETAEALAARSLQKVRVYSGATAWLNSSVVLVMGALLAAALLRHQPIVDAVTCFAAVGLSLEPLAEIFRARMMLEHRGARLAGLLQLIHSLADFPEEPQEPLSDEPWTQLDFDDVGWETETGFSVLRGVSFRARRGEVVGLLGRSGSGKSSLATLAVRLIEPTAGRILVDGRDVRQLDLTAYWRRAAYVPQLPLLGGAATAGDELAMSCPRASTESIERVLAAVGLSSQSPLALHGTGDTEHHEVRALRQRLEWARALLSEADLMVLDEPTDAADDRYERGFVAALAERKDRQITLLISHRPETLALCDRFLVLDHGAVLAETDDLPTAQAYLATPRAQAA